jgi:molybdopterin-containing oxidoreductase family membrane subunit
VASLRSIIGFWIACARELLHGSRLYWVWIGALLLALIPGALAYANQLRTGLIVTGMSDQVTWGTYIANFTYLVGMAAAAVMLVIPAYVFHNKHAKSVVLLAESLAASACIMALLFVSVDLGRPERFWHLIPMIGDLNFPASIMAWDVVALGGYLVINLAVPGYVLHAKYHGRDTHDWWFGGLMVFAIFWAIGIHTVTAFLYSSASGRVFWHSALLGPRFLASAFAAGPAFIVLAFRVIHAVSDFRIPKQVMRLLSLIIAIALQVNLFMLFAEVFTELYAPTAHSAPAQYLFVGLHGHTALVPWMWTAIVFEVIAVAILMHRELPKKLPWLVVACVLCTVGVWIEKGFGLIVPGFVPTPLGELLEYTPSYTETAVSFSIWAFGALVFTALAKPSIAIQLGVLRKSSEGSERDEGATS